MAKLPYATVWHVAYGMGTCAPSYRTCVFVPRMDRTVFKASMRPCPWGVLIPYAVHGALLAAVMCSRCRRTWHARVCSRTLQQALLQHARAC